MKLYRSDGRVVVEPSWLNWALFFFGEYMVWHYSHDLVICFWAFVASLHIGWVRRAK